MTEFFCGIGGCSACLPDPYSVVGVDINQNALQIYRRNFPQHSVVCRAIESLDARQVNQWPVQLWWLSPPCQPYTRRGKGRDLDDPRSAGMLRLLDLIERLNPKNLVVENVPEFSDSKGCQRLMQILKTNNYQIQHRTLCSTQLRSLNRRRRFFLIASTNPLWPWKKLGGYHQNSLQLDQSPDLSQLIVSPEEASRYGRAMHVVEPRQLLSGAHATRCFTSAYGRSPVRSGSFLNDGGRIRRFSPREILNQLDFPQSFELPDWPYKRLWPLVGNSLALSCVRYVLSHLPITTSPLSDDKGIQAEPLSSAE